MRKELFKIILKANGIATCFSLTLSMINYQLIKGFEARQVGFLLLIMTILLCVFNFILSLLGLLSTLPVFINNKRTIVLFFCGLPFLVLLRIIIQFFSEHSESEEINLLELLSLTGPSLFYLIALFFFADPIRKIVNNALIQHDERDR